MSKVFVSYRRDDAQGEAGHLLADLRRRFDEASVFMDITGCGAAAGPWFWRYLRSRRGEFAH